MNKIHYYSDCSFFAGCENMISVFINSNKINRQYKISFSYRYSLEYALGLNKKIKNNIPIFSVNFPYLSKLFSSSLKIPQFIRKPLALCSVLFLTYPLFIYEVVILFRLFKKINPDILHVNSGGYPAALSTRAAVIAAKLAGVCKVLMVVNNMAVDYKHPLRWFDYPLDLLVKSQVDLFITGSEVAKKRLGSVLKLPAEKTLAIHNGVTLRASSASKLVTKKRLGLENFEGVIFGIVALLVPRKGHQVLLEAVLKIITEYNKTLKKPFKLLIEGDGVLRQELINFVNKNNLNDWVCFVGEEENIVDFMSIIDVLILSSIESEDFPNVIIEAMGLGKAVIASRLAGTPEQVIDGVTGLLIEPRNSKQLADAICEMINQPERRVRMAKAGQERFNHYFSSHVAVENYINTYEALLETRGLITSSPRVN